MKRTILFSLGALLLVAGADTKAADKKLPGYTDTPIIPGQKWRVHGQSAAAEVVEVGASKTLGLKPPKGAVVLFNGTDTSKWSHDKWKIEEGHMEVTPKSGSLRTKDSYGSVKLHLEFATPKVVKGDKSGPWQ